MEIRGDSTKWLTTLLMLYSAFWVGIDGSSRQPHIILILADDLGWDDVSFHGSDQIPTPNIDDLAYNGVVLHNYYVQPICTPTRSALMTGRHPIHTGLQHNVIVAPQPYGLRPNETTMAEYLKPLGYATHMIGKWHLGFFAKEYTPTYRGFDSYYGYYCGHMDYYTHNVQWSKYWGYDMHKNMEVEWPTFGEYSTELFTMEAEKILKSHNPDKPLFLYLAYQAVHSANNKVPLQAPYKYTSRFPYIHDEKRRTFAGRNISVSHDPRAAVVHCGKKPANASTNCQPKQKPCLYNVVLDPCEYHNIAEQYPDVVSDMLSRLNEYNSTAVEPQHPPEDPKSDPKYHKEAWVPWINLTDSDTV